MKLHKVLASAVAIIGLASVAEAATTLRTTGTITGADALLNGAFTALPSGSISVGDKFSLTAKFDPGAAQLDPLYDANPTFNLYYLPGTRVSLKVGSWKTTFTAAMPSAAQILLTHSTSVDAQSFWLYDYAASNNLPIDMGAGTVLGGVFDLNYDFTATARSNDLITQLASLDRFPARTFTAGFFNYDTLLNVGFHGQVEETSLVTTDVPEPASWALMLTGFGLIGALARRRHNLMVSFA